MVAGFLNDFCPKFYIVLIYQATRDGWTADNFHNKCDYQGPTITIVKTNKNRIFGGFTTQTWDKLGHYKSDSSAFVYSVDLGAKFAADPAKNVNAIYCHATYGPTFGDAHFIYIANNPNGNTSSYCKGHACTNYPNSPKNPAGYSSFLDDGEQNLQVSELEVYKVIPTL